MSRKKSGKLLSKLAKTVRATVAGRRKSDEVILRALRSDAREPTVWRNADPAPDEKTPLCPKCGATMLHAKGQRSRKPEFWACSRLECNGTREIEA